MATRAKNKKEKGVDYYASIDNLLKKPLFLNGSVDFEIILQECSFSDLLLKLPKWSCSAEQNGHQS